MKKFAFLFPGQGAQYPGMGKDFSEAFAVARQTFEEADDILREPFSKIIFDGSEAELTKTKHSQIAIFIVSAALLKVLQSQFPSLYPSVCAGLSLGEYTALWASGRLSFQQTLLLVQGRANFMNEACEKVPGTMAAILGLDADTLDAVVKDIDEVWVANYNCPGQIVISGTKKGCDTAASILKAEGAKRIIPLQVHGAFHSGLMQQAQDALSFFIAEAPLKNSLVGFAMNTPGDFVTDLDEIRRNLTLQVTSSVRWQQAISAIEKKPVDLYLEVGCGKILTGFNKKIGVAPPTLSIEKVADLETLARELETCSKVFI